jgi:hypothetical protein
MICIAVTGAALGDQALRATESTRHSLEWWLRAMDWLR